MSGVNKKNGTIKSAYQIAPNGPTNRICSYVSVFNPKGGVSAFTKNI